VRCGIRRRRRVGGRSFSTPDSGLIGALYCPAGDGKIATIAEFLFIRLFDDSAFFCVAVKWKNVSFFAFAAILQRVLDLIGVLWRFDALSWWARGWRRAGLFQALPESLIAVAGRFFISLVIEQTD
jgi:hypothetical protein